VTRILLDKEANTEVKDKTHKFTPLHHVCKRKLETNENNTVRRFYECLIHLINSQADVNAKDGQNNSPIIYAAENSLQSFKYLIEHNADVNARNEEGKTLLHIAAEWGQTEIARYLIEEKIGDINARDNAKDTPLHYSGIETCEMLISAGIVHLT
jgi:ankyrin repeat protein